MEENVCYISKYNLDGNKNRYVYIIPYYREHKPFTDGGCTFSLKEVAEEVHKKDKIFKKPLEIIIDAKNPLDGKGYIFLINILNKLRKNNLSKVVR